MKMYGDTWHLAPFPPSWIVVPIDVVLILTHFLSVRTPSLSPELRVFYLSHFENPPAKPKLTVVGVVLPLVAHVTLADAHEEDGLALPQSHGLAGAVLLHGLVQSEIM